jgi:hypothetical protein
VNSQLLKSWTFVKLTFVNSISGFSTIRPKKTQPYFLLQLRQFG